MKTSELITELLKVENKEAEALLYFDGEVVPISCIDSSECMCTQGHAVVEINAEYESKPYVPDFERIRVCDVSARLEGLSPKSLIDITIPPKE